MRLYTAVTLALCIAHMHTPGVAARRRLSATAMVSATTSPTSLDLAYISGNLTGRSAPPNATAASRAIVSLALMNSTSTVQTIATGFAAVLINGTHGSVTGQALNTALANTTNSTQQNVAQGYATAILAYYAGNYTRAAAAGIRSSLAVGQTGVVEAANSAAFGTSNASAIATANATALALAADDGTCTSYPVGSYGDALSSVLSDNDTEAAAAGIAAGFAQGCSVSSVTALSVLDLIALNGCTSILGGILLRAEALASLNSTGYAGGTVQFTTAAAQSVAIQRCLQEARVNASRPAASAATLATTALLAGNATAAASATQTALCSADTATATAEAFAEVISSSVGCNGTVRAALQSANATVQGSNSICEGAYSGNVTASGIYSIFFNYPSISQCLSDQRQAVTVSTAAVAAAVPSPPPPGATPALGATPAPTILPATPNITPAGPVVPDTQPAPVASSGSANNDDDDDGDDDGSDNADDADDGSDNDDTDNEGDGDGDGDGNGDGDGDDDDEIT